MSNAEDTPLDDLTDWDEVDRLVSELGKEGTKKIDLGAMKTFIKSKILGQDRVVDNITETIRQRWGMVRRSKPIASFLLVGPPGTGKTELCKTLAEYLYDSRDNMLLFSCGQLKNPADIARLIGSPQGYVGGSGELTGKMLANKRQIVVFDEIEKINPEILDMFLSMLGEGFVDDQKTGKRADFTEAIVIMTSNAEKDAIAKIKNEIKDPFEASSAVRTHLEVCGVFRPELIDRMTEILVFEELSGAVISRLTALMMRKMAGQYGLSVRRIGPGLLIKLLQEGNKNTSGAGARQRGAILERTLGPALLAAKEQGAEAIVLDVDEDGDIVVAPAD